MAAGILGGRPALSALGLGLVSALALPPVHALPVLWLAFPLLLRVLGGAPTWQRAIWLGFVFGFGHHAAGIYWVTHALFTDIGRWWWLVPVAAPGLALPLACFAALAALAAWAAAPGWRRAAAFAGAWTGAELLRGVMFTGFPWNLLGTAWAFHELPLQLASVVGVHGLSLLTAVAAALPVAGRAGWAASVALVAVLLGFGAWRTGQPLPPDAPARLVLVQGNIAQGEKWDEARRAEIFARYLDLTRDAVAREAAAHPDAPIAAVWPETASPFLLAQDPEAARLAAESLGGHRATLLAGTVRAEWGPDGRLARLFNSVAVLGEGPRLLALYDKHHLVPFGEYMPFGGILPIRLVTGGVDFSAGPGPRTVAIPGLPTFSPLICYEVIFPGRVAAQPRPDWLVNITNDAWFGISAGPHQHLAAARLRAVEEGLPLARAAQTGISAVFDARGGLVRRLSLGEAGVLAAPLPGALPPGIFANIGVLLPGGLATATLLLAMIRHRKGQHP